MNHYDDILNIYAYLKQRAEAGAQEARELLDASQSQLAQAKELSAEADDLLAQARQLAADLGVDISDIPAATVDATESEVKPDFVIHLPATFNFAEQFERLRREAREAGFTDTHPEDLLSPEELRQAELYTESLDAQFEKETGLRGKDMMLLCTAAMARVLVYLLLKWNDGRQEQQAMQALQSPAQAGKTQQLPLGAASGVDLDGLLNHTEGVSLQELLATADGFSHSVSGKGLVSKIAGISGQPMQVRSRESILSGPVPFDVPDNGFFNHDEIAGFDPILGWVVGVINIMTNTVTTRKMKSFSVAQMFPGQVEVGDKISTLSQVVVPTLNNAPSQKEAIVAAVVREASVLGVVKGAPEDLALTMQQADKLNWANQQMLNQLNGAGQMAGLDLMDHVGNVAVGAFINTLVSAAHAAMYRPETDGSINRYAIRTQKIITLSTGLAAVINSLPVLLAPDVTTALKNMDWSGIIMTLLSTVNTARFWVDAKAEFLMSEHYKVLAVQMAELDQYFTYD